MRALAARLRGAMGGHSRSVAHPRWARFWRWAISTREAPTYYRTFHCPKCGRTIRKRAPAIAYGVPFGMNEREIVARCPVDGHPPWNTPEVHAVEGIEVDD